MALNSFLFLPFFAFVWIVVGLIGLLKNKVKAYKTIAEVFLILVSYGFVAYVDWRFMFCLLFVTVLAYATAIAIKKRPDSKQTAIRIGVTLAVLMLGVFKYFDFFTVSVMGLFNIRLSIPFEIIMPLGVSFYTFSAISYMVDVYRGKYEAEDSFILVAFYMSYFPKFLSGPIVRANHFFDQWKQWSGLKTADFEIGIQMFVVGLFKKMVLADHLGVFVDNIYYSPDAYTSGTVLFGLITYTLQLYMDFSGYSDMALGVSRILGLKFGPNFNFPLITTNISDFWRRWHMSLSSWLQEYLYFALGGNRKGKVRTYINLMLTMMLGGMWHGSDWTYIVWGFEVGLGIVVYKMFSTWKKEKYGDKYDNNLVLKSIAVVVNFLYFTFGLIFIRANNIGEAWAVIRRVGQLSSVGIVQPYAWSFIAAAIIIVVTIVMYKKGYTVFKKDDYGIEYPLLHLNTIKGLTLFFVLIGLTIGLAYFGNTVFIYGKY